MGSVYKSTYSKPMPEGAELQQHHGGPHARWRDRYGKLRSAPVRITKQGEHRVVLQSKKYTAKYRDGRGLVRKVRTGCTTRDGALAKLRELEQRAEKVRSGLVTAAEDAVVDRQQTPLADHVEAYLDHLRIKRGKGAKPRVSPRHVANVQHQLRRVVKDCGLDRLADLTREAVERWVAGQLDRDDPGDGLSMRTINAHLASVIAFANWCVETRRLVANPLSHMRKLDESSDPRHKRRALTEDEINRLLYVARRRPLAEFGRPTLRLPDAETRGRRKWTKQALTLDNLEPCLERARATLADNPQFLARQERLGWERMLIYKTLLLTGLRKGELASLTVGDLDLSPEAGRVARLTIRAIEAKAGESAEIPLRADLAENLRAWLDDRLRTVQSVAEACDEPVPDRLPMDARVFRVPAGLVRILDRDLAVAGIPKRDDRGRVMDVHAQRHTFGTHLSRAGVPARATQAAMRHSTLDLTMQLYTDPRLLDIAGAIDALPALPDQLAVRPDCLGHHGDAAAAAARTLGPKLVPTRGRKRPESSYHVNGGGNTPAAERVVSDEEDVSCQEMATTVAKRAKGLEPSTFSLEG